MHKFYNIPNGVGVYSIINIIDDKVYVGSSINIKARIDKHVNELKLNRHHSLYLQFAWNKYGAKSFNFVVLEHCEKEKLIEREQFWIDWLNPKYNMAPLAASILGIKRSIETKLKMSEASKNRLPVSDYTRAKMSVSGKIKIITDSHKLNMAKSQAGRKHSEETKLKIKIAHLGKPKSEDHKKKNGLAKRNFTKWPHEKGNRCNCRICLDLRNYYNKIKKNTL